MAWLLWTFQNVIRLSGSNYDSEVSHFDGVMTLPNKLIYCFKAASFHNVGLCGKGIFGPWCFAHLTFVNVKLAAKCEGSSLGLGLALLQSRSCDWTNAFKLS